ncbi:variant SH3 domain-containing protein, partial [Aphelenchoides avenae]
METEENCRWFVALFDYDHHMSPNPSAQEEELSFRKHQLIKVHGDLDQDGFYKGQIGRRVGLVPSNMVFELAKDDLLPQEPPPRMQDAGYPLEPSIRRMRWGSLKSRSYDTAAGGPSSRTAAAHAAAVRDGAATVAPFGRAVRVPGSTEPMRRGLYEPREARQDAYYARQDEYDSRGDYRRRREASYAGRGADQRPSDRYDYPPDQRDRDHRDQREPRDHQRNDYPMEARDRGDMGRPHEGPMGARRDELGPGPGAAGPGQQPSRHTTRAGAHPSGGRSAHGGPSMQEMQQGTPGYGQLQAGIGQPEAAGRAQPSAPFEERVPKINGDVSTRVMIAKFDYDPVQSPNVDAEQVELGFRKEDLITVYGEMDEDGFFWGELRSEPGRMGLVPSNFLQELHEGSMSGMGLPAAPYGQPSTYSQERSFTGLPMEPTQPPIM